MENDIQQYDILIEELYHNFKKNEEKEGRRILENFT